MDCSLPGSSIHGIFLARVLEWGAIASSRSDVYYILNATLTPDEKDHIWQAAKTHADHLHNQDQDSPVADEAAPQLPSLLTGAWGCATLGSVSMEPLTRGAQRPSRTYKPSE